MSPTPRSDDETLPEVDAEMATGGGHCSVLERTGSPRDRASRRRLDFGARWGETLPQVDDVPDLWRVQTPDLDVPEMATGGGHCFVLERIWSCAHIAVIVCLNLLL